MANDLYIKNKTLCYKTDKDKHRFYIVHPKLAKFSYGDTTYKLHSVINTPQSPILVVKTKEGYWGVLRDYAHITSNGETIEDLIKNIEDGFALYNEAIAKLNQEKDVTYSHDLRREEDAWFKGFEVAQEAEKLSITRVDNLVKSKDFSELIKLVEYEIVDNKLSDEGKAIIGKAIDRANFYIQIKQPK